MLGLCALLGAIYGGGTVNASVLPVGLAFGAAWALVAVYLYGLVAWVLIRFIARRKTWTYLRAAYSPLVLSFVLLGMLGINARAIRDASTPATEQTRAGGPDPLGMKFAGQSDQISAKNAQLMNAHKEPASRFDSLMGGILDDYIDKKVHSTAWLQTSRSRLAEADGLLAEMTANVAQITDTDVRDELRAYDQTRADLKAAFNDLARAVDSGTRSEEGIAQRVVDERFASYERANQRGRDMTEPYLSEAQREHRRDAERDAGDGTS